MIPLDVGHDAGHVHLALERGHLPGLGRHVVHDVLDVGLSARADWKKEEKKLGLHHKMDERDKK